MGFVLKLLSLPSRGRPNEGEVFFEELCLRGVVDVLHKRPPESALSGILCESDLSRDKVKPQTPPWACRAVVLSAPVPRASVMDRDSSGTESRHAHNVQAIFVVVFVVVVIADTDSFSCGG